MLDNSNLKEPFDVSNLEAEVSSLVGHRSIDNTPASFRRPLPRLDKLNLEPGGQNYTEVATDAGAEDAPQATGIEAVLIERAKTHGDFTDNARVMQALKRIVHDEVGWNKLTDVQREALHMILHKIGRIISGNPNVKDHWDDIAGYAKITSDRVVE